MGSGSTVAAAEAMGISAIGVERYLEYYEMSKTAIPQLAALNISPKSSNNFEPNQPKTTIYNREDQKLTL
jgi:site-specific DNA-methyltransferase (adenine-specific)